MVSSLREKVMARTPKILVFDSGLGGLTVFRALLERRPDAQFLYATDDLGFPYGPKSEAEVSHLVMSAMERLIAAHAPDCVVVACNTASTLVLPHLRDRWPKIPFVGTVPAIKPAAEQSQSRLISILATPGTVARDYTRDLIDKFAGHCDVTLVGSQKLAALAEAFMQGMVISDEDVAREIAPCFVERDGRRTDAIVLACTHYPLLQEFFTRLAPWRVHWIDPAAAIARRADHVISDLFPKGKAGDPSFSFQFTSGAAPPAKLTATLDKLRAAPPRPASGERVGVRGRGLGLDADCATK
jgi:glutamate racemase